MKPIIFEKLTVEEEEKVRGGATSDASDLIIGEIRPREACQP